MREGTFSNLNVPAPCKDQVAVEPLRVAGRNESSALSSTPLTFYSHSRNYIGCWKTREKKSKYTGPLRHVSGADIVLHS